MAEDYLATGRRHLDAAVAALALHVAAEAVNRTASCDVMQALDTADRAILALNDLPPERVWQMATEVTARLDLMRTRVAAARARAAAGIAARDGLSLAGLADVLGCSKARADQLVRAGTSG